MISVALGLATIAFILSVLLLFGAAAMLRIIRELQAAVIAQQGAVGTREAVTIAPLRADGGTAVLVVDDRCGSCAARQADFEALASSNQSSRQLMVVKPAGDFPNADTGHVRYLVDPVVVGQIQAAMTPSVVVFDEHGREQFRRIATSRKVLEDVLRNHIHTDVSAPVAPASQVPQVEEVTG